MKIIQHVVQCHAIWSGHFCYYFPTNLRSIFSRSLSLFFLRPSCDYMSTCPSYPVDARRGSDCSQRKNKYGIPCPFASKLRTQEVVGTGSRINKWPFLRIPPNYCLLHARGVYGCILYLALGQVLSTKILCQILAATHLPIATVYRY